MPYEGKKDEDVKIERVTGQNEAIHSMIMQAHAIIIEAIPENTDVQAAILAAVNKYASTMSMLTQHRELIEIEKDDFQDDADSLLSNG